MAKKDYTNWDRKELIKEIDQLRKRKKYGLVWEDKLEDVVERCKTELPVLEEVKNKEIITNPDKPINLLIEGDNYHALSVLNYTHKGKIDVIYIDPPYNTGAKDWKYNNDYVDSNDMFRHSKWICMMQHRLKIAKHLLKRNGILLTAIDDNEFATLKLLLEDLLPGHTHEVVVVNHHPQGSGGANVSATHEYCIVSVPRGQNLFVGELVGKRTEEWSLIKAGAGKDYYRIGRPNMFFAIHVDKKSGQAVGVGPELKNTDNYPRGDTDDGYKRIYPLDKKGDERRWRYGRPTMTELIKKGRIKGSLPKYSMKVVMPRDESFQPLYSNWTNSKYNAGPHGTALLKNILPNTNFPYPKSLFTVFDFIAGATRKNKNAVILDFFAGSGTTGHAVLELNQNDGGARSFILCTNNENSIAEEVTYPRVNNVIKGYKFTGTDRSIVFEKKITEKMLEDIDLIMEDLEKMKEENKKKYDKFEIKIEENNLRLVGIKNFNDKKDGLGGNLKYFKTAFVPAAPTDKNKTALTKKATEMLCVKEETFEKVKSNEQYVIFGNGKRYTGIIYDHQAIDVFKKEISKIDGKFSVYVFSLGDDIFDEEFDDMKKKVKLSPIPEAILRVYRRIFK
jgi:adenine-specific DNA-methyltransferase